MTVRLPMGQKDLLRITVMDQTMNGQSAIVEAAVRLKMSYRQAKRIYARYRSEGAPGVLHRSIGRVSNNKIDGLKMHQAIEAYRANYWDFGPTLASEKLQEREGLVLSRETLRRALIAEGLWMPTRRKRAYHARRPPRSRFGELLQFDGSHHRWFEDRGERCCLMNMVDDATGTTLSFLTEQETTAAAMKLLWAWIERYGIPQAVYCDKKNAYVPLITDIDLNDYLLTLQKQGTFLLCVSAFGARMLASVVHLR